MSYEQYMKQVDGILSDLLFGMTSEDLADTNTRDFFDDGLTPHQAALAIIEGDDLASAYWRSEP